MRIGIDARELCGKPTGVGRHLAGLLGAWQADARAGRHALVLFAHHTPVIALPPNVSVRVVPGAGGTWWEQTALAGAANRERLDVFFAPGYTAPLRLTMPSWCWCTICRSCRTRSGSARAKAFVAGCSRNGPGRARR